ncbi:Ankyrin_repeat protein 2 [Hexamita inflata]|uniref:Ankyrin_repeat protein 2 n=1 Tax=Hexamita inflata TaxID=28002 RepID=A0ABP1M0Z6_9EUKA
MENIFENLLEESSDFELEDCGELDMKMYHNSGMLKMFAKVNQNQVDEVYQQIDSQQLSSNDAILYAVMQDKTSITTKLFERYGFVVENSKKTPLMIAAQNNNVELVKLFMSQAKSRDAAGMTALMHAVVHDSLDCIKLLKQAEKEIKDNSGWNAMQYADGFRSDEAIAALL